MPSDPDRPEPCDVVFIDTLSVEANVGADWWGKKRPQPLQLSIYLHLRPGFLDKSGATDDVTDSVHYGHLTKVISKLIRRKTGEGEDGEVGGFDGIDGLVQEVAQEAFDLAGDAAGAVRVVVDAPKLLLLASNLSVDTVVSRNHDTVASSSPRITRTVTVSELTLPVLIGVNPPERLAKQRVVTDLVFREVPGQPIAHTEYQTILNGLVTIIESSDFLTLEKFVMELVRAALVSSKSLESVTIRAQKPSALSFARFSGVEITRRRADLMVA